MLLFCNFFPDTDTNLNFGAFYDPSWAMITNPWQFFGQYMLTVKSPFIGDLLCCGINNSLQNILLFCWRFILIMLNKILIELHLIILLYEPVEISTYAIFIWLFLSFFCYFYFFLLFSLCFSHKLNAFSNFLFIIFWMKAVLFLIYKWYIWYQISTL